MISIIIPVYNGEETIKNCLDSVLNQSYKGEYEIILIDDGSSDRTLELAKEYPIKLLTQQHRGPAVARNLGAKEAQGDILLFTDSDCIAEKNWIMEMVRPFGDSEIVGVQGRYKTKQIKIMARFVQYEIEERYEKMEKDRYIDFVGSYSAGYRRNIFISAGGFDSSFPIASGEDPDLSFRLSSEGYKMVFNPSAVVFHRHPESLSKYLKQKFYRAYWRIPLYKKNYRKIVKESYTPQLLKIQIGVVYLLIFSLISSIFTSSFKLPLFLFVILILSTIPLTIKMLKNNIKTGLIAPLVLVLRSIAFGSGLIYGIIKSISR